MNFVAPTKPHVFFKKGKWFCLNGYFRGKGPSVRDAWENALSKREAAQREAFAPTIFIR
jgi:hypothetical protein